ncbi:MAG: AIPR family protein [Inhella sp.]|uniref:AIPR family protein n=1 Tax=Inhella sp. TaxID=1921806 RepID=UPI0022C771EE|nr:AIPR family protein [Inhella sp.]MCZ8234804.1 AIPR family protein [Inhella sp.]
MATEPRPLQIQQLQAYLTQQYELLIQGKGDNEQQRERNFLSKAVAAHFLVVNAGVSKAEAVEASIDGGGDHGIDAVWISPTQVIWLVQSKYHHSGIGEPGLHEVGEFVRGVRDLLAGEFGRFNAALNAKRAALQRAMGDLYTVRVALAYTGTSLGDDRLDMFKDLLTDINAVQPERARFIRFGLNDFHDALMASRAEAVFTEEIELRNYGMVERPRRSFFGVMRVAELAALYRKHDNALVRANIRRYRGSSRVNEEMLGTLRGEPEHFVYFNNGVTLLCERITQVGNMPLNRSQGRFRLEGVSVINGAQTAGTVAREDLPDADLGRASVLVTCIEANPADDAEFGDRVTRYRNNQNAVLLQDFMALDDNQENWRRTLKASGITYIYKPSSVDPAPGDSVFTAQDAARFLALALSDKTCWPEALLLAAGSDGPASLWDTRADFKGQAVADPAQSAYKRLFPDHLTARRLWRVVQMGRLMRNTVEDDAAAMEAAAPEQADKELALANLAMHLVLLRAGALQDAATLRLTTPERGRISSDLDEIRRAVRAAYDAEDWGGELPVAVMRQAENLRRLKAKTMAALAAAQGQ